MKALDGAWYLAQLKPGGLNRAKTNLARQGYDSFMPLREETLNRAGRWSTISRPLFPGYLFVNVSDDRQSWASINSTFGVSRLVALEGGRPTRISSDIIKALQARVNKDGRMQSLAKFKVGDQVEVISGPLVKRIAEIEAIPEEGRIYVFLELMGRYVKTELPAVNLELRSATPRSIHA